MYYVYSILGKLNTADAIPKNYNNKRKQKLYIIVISFKYTFKWKTSP